MPKQLWWQKHRPSTLDNFIFQNQEQEMFIRKCVEEKSIPHLLLHGPKGSGKTTLAEIIISALVEPDNISSDVLRINGSKDGKIDNIRNQLVNHVTCIPMGDIQIVFVDEADGLSSSAQDSLRGILEMYDKDARVIFTCNYVNRLTPELRSRFTQMKFNHPSKDSVIEYCADILDAEGVSLEDEGNLKAFKEITDSYTGDLRQLVISLDNSTYGDSLKSSSIEDASVDIKLQIFDSVAEDNWIQARRIAAENFSDDELIEVYRFLYEYLEDMEKFDDPDSWKKGIVIISDNMYRHATHPDQEINFASCLIRLSEV